MSRSSIVLTALLTLTVTACMGQSPEDAGATSADSPGEQLYPDVIEVEVARSGEGGYRFDVTISSPYDTPERYADAWRVKGPDGTVYGVRELLHDHSSEQPFTRSLDGVEIPADVTKVTVEARDLENGWGGETLEVTIP
jgi:hypothetical protein